MTLLKRGQPIGQFCYVMISSAWDHDATNNEPNTHRCLLGPRPCSEHIAYINSFYLYNNPMVLGPILQIEKPRHGDEVAQCPTVCPTASKMTMIQTGPDKL